MSIDNNCYSKQTFCSLGKQIVSQNMTLNFNGCINKKEIIEDNTWNELIDAVIQIYNFGVRGERNPDQPFALSADTPTNASTSNDQNETAPSNKISTILKNSVKKSHLDLIKLQDYNQILSIIENTTLDTNENIIYGTYFEDIHNKLNNYSLDPSRCDNCNVKCNVTCQASSQCCTQCCTDCCTNECCTNCCTDYGEECWQHSARIYKENIQDYTQNALDIINSTKIVEFNYKTDPEKNQKIGFIADNTDAQLASKNHNIMDMYNCIGVLLKAVQELSAEIEELKKQKKEEF